MAAKSVQIMKSYKWTVNLPGYIPDEAMVQVTSGIDGTGCVFCRVISVTQTVQGQAGQVHVRPGKNINIPASSLN